MYKYVSKNLLFVATVAPKASGHIGSADPDEAWLVAYLIDTIAGRILHRMTHHGAQGPVHAVSSNCLFSDLGVQTIKLFGSCIYTSCRF